jgi:hypothetical protein
MSTPASTTAKSKRARLTLVIVCLGLGVLAWIAFRTVRGLMKLGYVDSAIVRVRAVATAETEFAKAHPDLGYTCTLSQLPHDDLIARLANEPKENGYTFGIAGCQAADPKKPNSMYYVTARPLHPWLPAFCSGPSGVIRYDDTGSVKKCVANGVPLG